MCSQNKLLLAAYLLQSLWGLDFKPNSPSCCSRGLSGDLIICGGACGWFISFSQSAEVTVSGFLQRDWCGGWFTHANRNKYVGWPCLLVYLHKVVLALQTEAVKGLSVCTWIKYVLWIGLQTAGCVEEQYITVSLLHFNKDTSWREHLLQSEDTSTSQNWKIFFPLPLLGKWRVVDVAVVGCGII